MDGNRFIIKPSTDNPLDLSNYSKGDLVIDCNYEGAWTNVISKKDNHDNTFDVDIDKSDMVYLPVFPSDCITYDEMVEKGKDKYYWDALNHELYKFVVRSEINPFVKVPKIKLVGENGNPTQVVTEAYEFSKVDGDFFLTELDEDEITSNYIIIHGYPETSALRPYQENIYYYDDVHDQWYYFLTKYSQNKDNYYYDKTVSSGYVLRYVVFDPSSISTDGVWTRVNTSIVTSGDPFVEIIVTKDNIDDIDKVSYYCDSSNDTMYAFDYGQYFMKIDYTGTIYERPFEFYRKLQDSYYVVNDTDKVLSKKIKYVHGHPSKSVKIPDTDRIYYDSKNQQFYVYREGWQELKQDNFIVPQQLTPYTHLDIN